MMPLVRREVLISEVQKCVHLESEMEDSEALFPGPCLGDWLQMTCLQSLQELTHPLAMSLDLDLIQPDFLKERSPQLSNSG